MMISQEPLITVIMPAYNVEKFLERSVNSVINQDYHNLDILIRTMAPKTGIKKILGFYKRNS